jgi:hypothetical protein
MTIPLVILATGALVVGFLGMPAWAHLPDFWSEWLHGVVVSLPGAEEHDHDANRGISAVIGGSLAGAGGVVLAWVLYRDKPWQPATNLSPFHQLLMDKWRVDEFYEATIVRPMAGLASVAASVDRVAVDGMTKVAASAVRVSSFLFTRLQTGTLHAYGSAMAFGTVALTWWVLYPHASIDFATKGDAVHYVAGAGLGYEYRWDFDSNGEFDTEWGKDQRDVSFAYDDDAPIVGVDVKLTEVAGRNRGNYSLRVRDGQTAELNTRFLGDSWKAKPDSSAPPSVRVAEGKVYVRPGAGALSIEGRPVSELETEIAPGASFQVGPYAKLRVDTVIETTLAVRNVFGNVARTRQEIVIQPKQTNRPGSGEAVKTVDAATIQREAR